MKAKAIQIKETSQRRALTLKIFIEAVSAILIVIWLHTGVSKLIDYKSFSIQMQQSPFFHDVAKLATFGGPGLEIILAILLIPKRTRLIGMAGSCLLMSFFSWYVYHLMRTLPTLPCSCGGVVSFLNWPQHLALNIVLSVLSFIATIVLIRNKRTTNL